MPAYEVPDWSRLATSDVNNLVSGIFSELIKHVNNVVNKSDENTEELRQYVLSNVVDTDLPSSINLDITEPGNVTIDPLLNAQMPSAPLDSNYPSRVTAVQTEDHEFPDDAELSITYPTLPILSDISVPAFVPLIITPPTVTIPTVTFDVPSATAINSGGVSPEDSLVAALKAKLLSNIQNGGTMLNATVEADIWNRNLERDNQQLQDSVDKFTAQWAKFGWTLPDGPLIGGLLDLNNKFSDKRLDASREIAIKQAELEQQGMFKTFDVVVALEKVLFDNLNDYARRVFEASKETSDQVIKIFNSRIELYNTELKKYLASVEYYGKQVAAEASRAQAYAAQVEGIKAVVAVDNNRVDVYKAQLQAEAQKVDIFKQKVAIVSQKYEAEKLKVDTYKSKVDAYVAEINGITQKYVTSVEAFKAFVTAFNSSSENQLKFKELVMQGDIAELDARVKAWQVEMQGEIEENKLKLQALTTVAQIESNVAAGSLSALHAQASAIFQGTDQLNYNI